MRNFTLTVQVRSKSGIEPGEGGRVALILGYSAAAVGSVLTVGFNGVAQALLRAMDAA